MLPRAKIARVLSRAVVSRGYRVCWDLVAVIPEAKGGLCAWHAPPREGSWNFRTERRDGSRMGVCSSRKLSLARAIRRATQTARRIVDMDNSDLSRMARALHGADDARGCAKNVCPLGAQPVGSHVGRPLLRSPRITGQG